MLIMPEPPPSVSRHSLVALVRTLIDHDVLDAHSSERECEAKLDELMPGWRERVR